MREFGRQCVACLSTALASCNYSVDGKYPLLRCDRCGLMLLVIEEEIEQEFDDYWDEDTAKIYAQEAVTNELQGKYRRHFQRVSKLAPKPTLLDVGSGAGVCVHTAGSEFGFEAMGIEPSGRAVELARERYGVSVIQGLLEPGSQLPRDFGVLTLWDVIEHVADPEALVRCCASHLADDGIFVLETPDGNAVIRKLIRWLGALGWEPLDLRGSLYYRAHRYYFTREAMTELLLRCGFREIRFQTDHSMYEKELLYHARYGGNGRLKRWAIQLLAGVTRTFPSLGNKMIVTATKCGTVSDR